MYNPIIAIILPESE